MSRPTTIAAHAAVQVWDLIRVAATYSERRFSPTTVVHTNFPPERREGPRLRLLQKMAPLGLER